MSSRTPSSSFESAVKYLSSYGGTTSNTTKLELYGLFKYVTASPSPTTSRPSIFDFTGRAKWDAWSEAGRGYQTLQEAEARYIAIATEFGWSEEASPNPLPAATSGSELSEENNIWDSDSEPKRSGGGLGVGVSSMSRPAEWDKPDTSLHGAIVRGDITHLEELLGQNSTIDLNQKDEFGYTSLHLASDRGHLDVVKLLLEKGADPFIKDADGFTPRELAEIAGNDEIAALLLAPC